MRHQVSKLMILTAENLNISTIPRKLGVWSFLPTQLLLLEIES